MHMTISRIRYESRDKLSSVCPLWRGDIAVGIEDFLSCGIACIPMQHTISVPQVYGRAHLPTCCSSPHFIAYIVQHVGVHKRGCQRWHCLKWRVVRREEGCGELCDVVVGWSANIQPLTSDNRATRLSENSTLPSLLLLYIYFSFL